MMRNKEFKEYSERDLFLVFVVDVLPLRSVTQNPNSRFLRWNTAAIQEAADFFNWNRTTTSAEGCTQGVVREIINYKYKDIGKV